MTLVAMAVYDTDENNRSSLTQMTLNCLYNMDWSQGRRLFVIDNASCEKTQSIYREWGFGTDHQIPNWNLIRLSQNVGTAKAINLAWRNRIPGEMCVKMDNDVFFPFGIDWIDLMETVLEKRDDVGIVGLKRKDCEERPDHPNLEWFRSKLKFLPHQPGERWIVIEEVEHVMGTCQGYRSDLLDVIGYLYQLDGLYGFDDALASFRAKYAGWYRVFIPEVEIDHVDPPGETPESPYRVWKQKYSGERMMAYNLEKQRIVNSGDIFYDGEFETYEELIIK